MAFFTHCWIIFALFGFGMAAVIHVIEINDEQIADDSTLENENDNESLDKLADLMKTLAVNQLDFELEMGPTAATATLKPSENPDSQMVFTMQLRPANSEEDLLEDVTLALNHLKDHGLTKALRELTDNSQDFEFDSTGAISVSYQKPVDETKFSSKVFSVTKPTVELERFVKSETLKDLDFIMVYNLNGDVHISISIHPEVAPDPDDVDSSEDNEIEAEMSEPEPPIEYLFLNLNAYNLA